MNLNGEKTGLNLCEESSRWMTKEAPLTFWKGRYKKKACSTVCRFRKVIAEFLIICAEFVSLTEKSGFPFQ